MNLSEYQHKAYLAAIYPDRGMCNQTSLNYCLVGLGGEAGEFQSW